MALARGDTPLKGRLGARQQVRLKAGNCDGENVSCPQGIAYGLCLTHTFCSNPPANKRVLNGTPASGLWFPEGVVHVRPACAWRYKMVTVGRRVLQDGKTKSNRRIAFLPAAAVPADP